MSSSEECEDEIEYYDCSKDFKFDQKSFFLTFPRCEIEKQTMFNFFLVKHKPNVLIVCKEPHKDGTPHIHVWLEFNEKISSRNPRYFDVQNNHCNISKMRNAKRNSRKNVIKYMTKVDNNPLVFGCELFEKKRAIIGNSLINNNENLIDIINKYPEEIYNYDKLRNNIILYNIDKQIVPKFFNRKCFWIYGPSGIGKSYLVRSAFNNLYEKQNNIWWDGYNNEDVVLMDDFDVSCKKLTYFLKIWGDNYRFKAEIKGGVIQPIYKKFIITSNYSIEKILNSNLRDNELPDEDLIESLQRRFKEIYIFDRIQQRNIINVINN